MSAPSVTRLPRRRILAATARSVLTTVLMVVVYYRAPLAGAPTGRIALWLALGLLGLAVAVAVQARAITTSPTPRMRAIETIMVALPFLILLYASVYTLLSHTDPGSFSEVLSRTDALYYTMTVFSTVGFGDIVPTTDGTRIATMTQMITGLVAVGVVAKVLLRAVQRGVERAAPTAGTNGDAGVPPTRHGDRI